MRGTLCTCCVIFRTIFPFKMATIGPYMASSMLMSSILALVFMIWLLESMFDYYLMEGQKITPCWSRDLYAPSILCHIKYDFFFNSRDERVSIN